MRLRQLLRFGKECVQLLHGVCPAGDAKAGEVFLPLLLIQSDNHLTEVIGQLLRLFGRKISRLQL